MVTGNTSAPRTSFEHAKTALAGFGLDDMPVFEGASRPLLHRQSDFAHRSRLYGAAFGGAWGNADLLAEGLDQAEQPPASAGKHAANFLADRLRQMTEPATICAIGPLSNIALALRIAPDIGERIERIVCMGGAFHVPGNVTPSAEFNWWFDPEAAAIVLESDVPLEIVPLDATDRLLLDSARFGAWKRRFADTPIFRDLHARKFERVFAEDPSFTLPVWDAVAALYLLDATLAVRSEDVWVTADCSHGPSYGRVVYYADPAGFNLEEPGRPQARVVLAVDDERFWPLYEARVFGPALVAAV